MMSEIDKKNLNNSNEADLAGFEDASTIIKKGLLDVNSVDYSQTNVSYSQEPDGSFKVEWMVDDAQIPDFMKRLFPFIGAGILILISIILLVLFYDVLGIWLLAIALTVWAGYSIYAGIKNKSEKYTFLIGIDNFVIIHDRVFKSEKIYSYEDLKGVELLTTGTEDTWGQTMAITEKMGRYQLSGKKESIQLLCRTIEVLFRTVKSKRKKLGKDDKMTIVGM